MPPDEPPTSIDDVINQAIQTHFPGRSRRRGVSVSPGSAELSAGPAQYEVVRCGPNGHNLRVLPSRDSRSLATVQHGCRLASVGEFVDGADRWLKLSNESVSRYCPDAPEAWAMISDATLVFLRRVPQAVVNGHCNMSASLPTATSFNFTTNLSKSFSFGARAASGDSGGGSGGGSLSGSASSVDSGRPFVFGAARQPPPVPPRTDLRPTADESPAPTSVPPPAPTPTAATPPTASSTPASASAPAAAAAAQSPAQAPAPAPGGSPAPRGASPGPGYSAGHHKPSVLDRWLSQGRARDASPARDSPPRGAFGGVSVREVVKALSESRYNGNGDTPPRTPPGTPKRGRPAAARGLSPKPPVSPRPAGISHSPVPVPGAGGGGGDSPLSGSPLAAAISGLHSPSRSRSRSRSSSPLAAVRPRHVSTQLSSSRGESAPSDTSALVSSLARDMSGSPSGSSLHSCGSALNAREAEPEGGRAVAQTGTQTSPEGSPLPDRSTFSIGGHSPRLSPKLAARDSRPARSKRERTSSPTAGLLRDRAALAADSPSQPAPARQPARTALSPSVAECQRAVFAAFLWHEGLVHDAMACATYLKFNPLAGRQASPVRSDGAADTAGAGSAADRRQQRHSLEVSGGSHLHRAPPADSTQPLRCDMGPTGDG